MKFLLFSDLHFMPNASIGASWESLYQIQRRAEEEGCEFIIHAGDFCHGTLGSVDNTQVTDYVRTYNEFHIPSYHCLGNHDTDSTPYEEVLKYYHMPKGYYYFDRSGYRVIVCDPNYLLEDGEYVHFSLGNNAKYGPYCNFMPPEQLEWLEKTIASAPGSCVLISHESFEREMDGVKNAHQVRQIIHDANRKKPHCVLLCINGHYHRDHIRILDQVCYLDMNSASYDWVDNSHSFYPQKLCQENPYLDHKLIYNDLLYAIVTLEGTTITIEGIESSMFMGITREMTDNPPCDLSGRPVRPMVQSARITLG